MKSVLISIQPKWVEKIVHGEKTIEVRKSRPKIETPFKCYIYATKNKRDAIEHISSYRFLSGVSFEIGKVIGEFICDEIKTFESEFWDNETYERIKEKYEPMDFEEYGEYEYETVAEDGENNWLCQQSCLKWEELRKYIGQDIHEFYGWHISDLKIYNIPKELSDFRKPCYVNEEICYACQHTWYFDYTKGCDGIITRPPQSWCYVGELGE